MHTFDVSLLRSFIIRIRANSAEESARLAEFYLGYSDESSEIECCKLRFEIEEIEMTQNDALEVVRIEDVNS